MALLGTFSAAEGSGTTTTTGSRTSTAGSLVVAGAGAWRASPTAVAITSSLAGTYTEAREVNFGAGSSACYALAYNIGGTRGASHTLTNTPNTGSGSSVSGAEFDNIEATPTVTIGSTASGTSTSPSCTVTIPSGNATVVAILAYDGSSTTMTVSDGTEAIEADENNDQQAHSIAYKTGQSGTVTIAWTLGASQGWSCFAVAFSEPAGGGGGGSAVIGGWWM